MAWKLTGQWSLQKRWVVPLAIIAAMGMALLFWQQPPPPFGEDPFNRLHEGMTEDEVVAVLGRPPGDYRPVIWKQPDWYVSSTDAVAVVRAKRGRSFQELRELELKDIEEWIQAGQPVPPHPARVYWKRWRGCESGIDVAFDEQGRVIHWSLLDMLPPRPPPDPVRWVRWHFGW